MPTWLVKSWQVARTHPQLLVACCMSVGLLLQCWSSSQSLAVHEADSGAVATSPRPREETTIAIPTAPDPTVADPPAELQAIHHTPNLPLPDPTRYRQIVQYATFETPRNSRRPISDSRPAWLPGTIEANTVEEEDDVTSGLEITIRPQSRP
jgi:hypothetical protein